jgi:hypothetical protein
MLLTGRCVDWLSSALPQPSSSPCSVSVLQVDPSEAAGVACIRECLLLRAAMGGSAAKSSSKWGAYTDSILRNSKTNVSTVSTLERLNEMLVKLSREKSPYVTAMCFDILELPLTLDATMLLDLASTAITAHSPDGLVILFVGVLCVVMFRNLGEICNRSLYRVFDIICKQKPVVAARYFLLQLIMTYGRPSDTTPVGAGSSATRHVAMTWHAVLCSISCLYVMCYICVKS